MKLVFVYGPPASGKLTISQELAKITGFKLFHNQLVNKILDEVFEKKDDFYWKLSGRLKVEIIRSAARKKVKGMIITMMRGSSQSSYVRRIKEAVEKNKGSVYFVKIDCSDKEILKRAKNPQRKVFGKLTSPKEIQKWLRKVNMHSKLINKNHLEINTMKMTPKEAAMQIKSYYKLS